MARGLPKRSGPAEELRPRLAASPYFIVNPASKRGSNWGRMGERSLADLLKLLLSEAEIAGNTHRFWHSYATMVVRQTANLEVSRLLLGHSDIRTTSHYVHANSQDRHDAADKVDLVPPSDQSKIVPPVPRPTTRASPLQMQTVAVKPRDSEERSLELLPLARPAASLPQLTRHLMSGTAHTNSQDRCGELLAEAVGAARNLPPTLLVHLNSERLVEFALGSCITTGLTTEVFLATAGAVLSWAHDLPLPLDTLLATYGPDVVTTLSDVRSTLELLSTLDPSCR